MDWEITNYKLKVVIWSCLSSCFIKKQLIMGIKTYILYQNIWSCDTFISLFVSFLEAYIIIYFPQYLLTYMFHGGCNTGIEIKATLFKLLSVSGALLHSGEFLDNSHFSVNTRSRAFMLLLSHAIPQIVASYIFHIVFNFINCFLIILLLIFLLMSCSVIYIYTFLKHSCSYIQKNNFCTQSFQWAKKPSWHP